MMNISRAGYCWEYAGLAAVLKERCHGKKIYYLPCHGNWGDGLIREGTLAFFKMLGLTYVEISRRALLKHGAAALSGAKHERILIYGGGGGWCRHYPESAALVQRVRPQFSEVIVLPSSYELSQAYDKDVVWFARDHHQSLKANPAAIFCHDMAFCLSPESRDRGDGDGWFLRTDRESAGRWEIPPGNIDISLQGNHKKPGRSLFSFLDQYASIHTDRLHIAIAAALLGKQVSLYPGAYFKNEAVWRSSLENFYPRVTFVSAHEA